MMLRLVKPSAEFLPAFKRAIDEQRDDLGTKLYTPGVLSLIKMIDEGRESEWLENISKLDNVSLYWLMNDDEYIGCFTFRHDLTEKSMQRGGNLGYNIIPSQRRKGYAYTGVSMVLAEANKLGFDKIQITCGTDNEKSYGVIKKAVVAFGGEFLPDSDLNEHRAWVNTSISSKVLENSDL